MAGKLSAFFGAQDMTVGNPATNLIRFSTPLLIGNLAQQLYSTVDSIVVGNYVGDSALAAIGASGPIINLLLVLFMGVSVGASIMASQYFGAKDKKRLSHSVGTAITATFAVSIFIMVVGPLITHPIMLQHYFRHSARPRRFRHAAHFPARGMRHEHWSGYLVCRGL